MSVRFTNAQSNTGICTATAPVGTSQTTWNLCSLQVSQAGGTVGPNAKLTIWDGAVGTGNILYSVFLTAPGAGTWTGTGGLGGSSGVIQDIPLPRDPQGRQGVQGTPGNPMNVQVTGTGNNQVSINASFTDGIPQ